MPRIEIDDDVFRYLQANAIAYVETPNDTLRRLLAISGKSAPSGQKAGLKTGSGGHRRPKASLGRLIRDGVIQNGQKLHLRDYQGRQVPDGAAIIGGDGLFANDERRRLYSMSDLAAEILRRNGYKADAVRGPSHWFTDEGVSITQLWENLLDA